MLLYLVELSGSKVAVATTPDALKIFVPSHPHGHYPVTEITQAMNSVSTVRHWGIVVHREDGTVLMKPEAGSIRHPTR